jgi:rubrerythrin
VQPVQQQAEWEAVPAAAAVEVDGPWACQVCTYEHTGAECKFLSCAICGTPKNG